MMLKPLWCLWVGILYFMPVFLAIEALPGGGLAAVAVAVITTVQRGQRPVQLGENDFAAVHGVQGSEFTASSMVPACWFGGRR